MAKLSEAIKIYRSKSQLDAYSKKISDWLIEVKDNGLTENFMNEIIEYVKQEEDSATDSGDRGNRKEQIDALRCRSLDLR